MPSFPIDIRNLPNKWEVSFLFTGYKNSVFQSFFYFNNIIKRIEIEPIDKITANIVFYTNFSDNFKMSIAKECRGKANCSGMTNGHIFLTI